MERKPPKNETQIRWKQKHSWLNFTSMSGMKCELCCKWSEKIRHTKHFSDKFIKGSTNYKTSALDDHEKSDQHELSIDLQEKQQAETTGVSRKRKHITQNVPENSAIKQSFRKMSINEKDSLSKLFDIAFIIAKKGRPYTDFKDLIEVEKAHGVKYTVQSYCNNKQCTEFVKFISLCLFDETIKEKVLRSNFISILCDGSTDCAIIEKECIYCLFVDPDTFQPTLSFFSLKDVPSQDAAGVITFYFPE